LYVWWLAMDLVMLMVLGYVVLCKILTNPGN
jgi:hypothetical protein